MARILVVDDVAANRAFLVSLLQYHGHTLFEAADGGQGLIAARAERPDLVITDVLMPVMDGYELVKHLRLDPTTHALPVIFYTAHYGEREARALAQASGVADVLTKPVEPETVLMTVARVLSGDPAPAGAPLTADFDREHLRLVTDKLSDHTRDLVAANARLRALINIGLELASEKDSQRLLINVCVAARDLFGATYVTLGILDRGRGTLAQLVSDGTDATAWITVGDTVPGMLATVVAERRIVRGHNGDGDPARLQLPARHPPIEAFLAAPIASPTHVYGWICLVGNEGRPFTLDDESLVTALSGQVGRTYENGYFYQVAQKERDRAQRYLDTADVMLLALDLDGRITLINRKGCDLLGYSEGELPGRKWSETCLPPRVGAALAVKFQDLTGSDLSVVESPVLTKAGAERLIEWRNTVLRDDAGHVIGTLSSGLDITERKHAEAEARGGVEALRVAEERMRFALESADIGIWDLDYATGVLRWSEILEAQYGLPPRTFAGTFDAFLACIHPDDRAAAVATIGKAAASGEDFTVMNRAHWPDGTVRWLSGAGRIHLDSKGVPVRGVGISTDVTARRTLEQQFLQAQKMEAVGRLAGGVAHDFNNLLTAILGYCELLLSDMAAGDPVRRDLGEIQKAGHRAASLTAQLLAFSRKQIIELTLLNLNAVVNDLRPMLGRLIGEDVRVVVGLAPSVPFIKADRGQIDQIIMNLAVNGRDAMPKGGTLTIETSTVDVDEDYARLRLSLTPGPYVMLSVTDTGTGIPPEVQSRLFEPFFTTKEPGKGTGLGLATVHGIVTRFGGSIGVYSEVGQGTTFTVYFPASAVTDVVVTAPAATSSSAASQTVLVVEDEPGLRELTQRLLERRGYTVYTASDPESAIRAFDEHPAIDLLLTDVVMPGASGPDLAKELIARRPALKVVYMSGYTEEAIVQHGVLKPGIAFLNKPFTSATLLEKFREVLER